MRNMLKIICQDFLLDWLGLGFGSFVWTLHKENLTKDIFLTLAARMTL